MATINDTNLVLDEQIGVQDATNDDDGTLDADNDVKLDATLTGKLVALGVDGISGGTTTTGFPQVAVNTALLDTTDATNLALSIPDGDGTSSGLFTVDGVEIFLYRSDDGVIYGREAVGGVASPTGDLAFAVALDLSGGVSSAQIYLIQYEPLQHNTPDAIDDDDTLSFAEGKITLDVTTTKFVTTFQLLDFASIPSGSPRETLTVATASTTDNHSAFFDGIIFPAGTVDDPTLIDKNQGTNDDLNPDAIGFGVKGGQASQLNQNEGFFVQDAAWTAADPDANEIGGLRFDIQGIGGVKSVDIEWWTVDNGVVVDTGTDHVILPKGGAVYENYTIEPTDSVDQIYVRFTYDTKPATAGVRVENLEVAFPSTTEETVVNHEDLGTHLVFEDAGPTVTVNDITDATYAAGGTGTWSEAPDADGFKSLSITLNNYTIDAHTAVTVDTLLDATTDASGHYVFDGSITGDFTDDGVVNEQTTTFKLTFNPDNDTYTFEATSPPSSTTTISSANGSLDAGGPDPVRTLTIENRSIVFSAVDATASVADIEANLDKTEGQIQTDPLPSYLSSAQMNVSTAGIGLANNNFDGNALAGVDGQTTKGGAFDESFVVDPTNFLVSGMKIFIDNSVGGYNPSTEGIFYRIFYDNGTTSGTPTKVTNLTPEAGGQVSFEINSAQQANDIDAVQLFMGSGTVKVPVIEFNISEAHPAESLTMNFTATISDNDSDTHQDAFKVAIA